MLKTGNGQGPSPRPPAGGRAHPRRTGAPDGTIAVLQTHSLPGLVQRELERMILAGELAAGAKLNEVAIAERLGVSRGPVREAFRALEESGLVRLEKNRGVFVRQIAVEEADEIYELRAVLDEFVGRRVAQKITPADIEGAARARRPHGPRRRRATTSTAITPRTSSSTTRWWRSPATPSSSRRTARLVNELHLYRRATLAQAGALPVSAREHHEILDKIAAGQASRRRPRAVRPRDGQPRAHASRDQARRDRERNDEGRSR